MSVKCKNFPLSILKIECYPIFNETYMLFKNYCVFGITKQVPSQQDRLGKNKYTNQYILSFIELS